MSTVVAMIIAPGVNSSPPPPPPGHDRACQHADLPCSVKPDMPDGTLRHGAMLDYSCTLVASERSLRNSHIATEKRKEEEKKINKEWNEQLEGFQEALLDKIFALTDQVSAALLPPDDSTTKGEVSTKKKKKKKDEEHNEAFQELPQFVGKANAPGTVLWLDADTPRRRARFDACSLT
jgi:hypothetical protein